MEKIDLRKQLKAYYFSTARQPSLVDVPPFNYLMIDGHGDPNSSPEYIEALNALYSLAYTLKFALKKGPEAVDYTIMGLEGLWWVPDMNQFSVDRKENWDWTMMILQPDFITQAHFYAAVDEIHKKKPSAALEKVRLECFNEGLSAQILHIGPYAAEGATVERLHQFIAEMGYALRGKHHEIYLGDPRRTAPEKLRTILRQPVEKI